MVINPRQYVLDSPDNRRLSSKSKTHQTNIATKPPKQTPFFKEVPLEILVTIGPTSEYFQVPQIVMNKMGGHSRNSRSLLFSTVLAY